MKSLRDRSQKDQLQENLRAIFLRVGPDSENKPMKWDVSDASTGSQVVPCIRVLHSSGCQVFSINLEAQSRQLSRPSPPFYTNLEADCCIEVKVAPLVMVRDKLQSEYQHRIINTQQLSRFVTIYIYLNISRAAPFGR